MRHQRILAELLESSGLVAHYRAIDIDVGGQDRLQSDTTKLHEVLDRYGIPNGFKSYHGTHTSAVADRFQNHVMPFFSKHLCFRVECRERHSAMILSGLEVHPVNKYVLPRH